MDENKHQKDGNNKTPQPSFPRNLSRPNWGRIIAWVGSFFAILVLLLIVGLSLLRSQKLSVEATQNLPYFLQRIVEKLQDFSHPIKIGKEVPNFTLTTFDNDQISLDSLRGKVVVINFWASWCIPCEEEAEYLEAAWRYYQPRGDVVFLGIDWTDTEKNGLAYIKKFSVTYQNGPDLGTRISQKFRITGVPETYIVDKKGKLASMKLFPYSSLEEIKAAIDPLLEE